MYSELHCNKLYANLFDLITIKLFIMEFRKIGVEFIQIRQGISIKRAQRIRTRFI